MYCCAAGLNLVHNLQTKTTADDEFFSRPNFCAEWSFLLVHRFSIIIIQIHRRRLAGDGIYNRQCSILVRFPFFL